MADNEGEDRTRDETDDADETGPLLSFDTTDATPMPHWAEPGTGELPVTETGSPDDEPADASRSRLFPQLPDDPNLVDASGIESFERVEDPSAVSGFEPPLRDPGPERTEEELRLGSAEPPPTGPMQLDDIPPAPHDTTVIRGLGAEEPGAMFDRDPVSDAVDEELRAASALGGGNAPDYSGPDAGSGDVAGSASLGGDEPLFDDAADQDPFSSAGDAPGRVPEDFPRPPDVSQLYDDEEGSSPAAPDAPGARPTVSIGGSSQNPDVGASGDDADDAEDGDAWTDFDAPAPHWREGSQDYEEPQVATDDDRTVLHFDDEADAAAAAPSSGGRNLPVAIAVGATLAAAFFGLLSVGPGATMVLVVAALVLATAEFFDGVRNVGYRPAALLGLGATGGLALAVYWKGLAAYPLVFALLIVAGLLWFLLGVETEHTTANLAITVMGVAWVGGLGSFAALILKAPHGDAVLIGAVIGTVAYDIGGYVIGATTGQSRIAPHISPNKTYEGLIGGMILAVVVTTVVLNRIPGVYPWTSMSDALWLGVAVAVLAPIGDLAQSLVKRDLGIKDMGTMLPGHGGVFDRFDGLLFVLPGAYYVSDLVNLPA